jgi:hypothetical protein
LILIHHIGRLFEVAPHQFGKGSIFEKDSGIAQPLPMPPSQFIHLQVDYSSQLALSFTVKVLERASVKKETSHNDARSQKDENQEKNDSRLFLLSSIFFHALTLTIA